MTADLTRVDQWISQTLKGDATILSGTSGRIFVDEAPQGAASPMVVFAFLGGADKVLTLSSRFTNVLYLIRAITQGSSYDAIEALADRIDDVLRVPPAGLIIRDTLITSCRREQPFQRKDEEDGIPVMYLGGFYRILFQVAYP